MGGQGLRPRLLGQVNRGRRVDDLKPRLSCAHTKGLHDLAHPQTQFHRRLNRLEPDPPLRSRLLPLMVLLGRPRLPNLLLLHRLRHRPLRRIQIHTPRIHANIQNVPATETA
jgi:hypothetical protein